MKKIIPAKPGSTLTLSLLIFGAFFVTPPPATAKDSAPSCQLSKKELRKAIKRSQQDVETYEEKIREEYGEAPNHGFSVAVSVCGKIVWREGFGYADLENKVAVTPETKFRIGSVSKTMTSAAIGQLVEAGALDLDAEIQTYLPDYPRKAYPVTTRELAGHLAGVRDYKGDEFYSAVHYDTVRDGLSIFKDDPLIHKPGSTYKYTTFGWNLLSAVLEGASGEDYLAYMQENVFDPAGMADTTADRNADIIPHRTRFYHIPEGETQTANAPYVDLSNKWAGGGFIATPSDVLKFARAMTDGTLVSADGYDLLTTSQATDDGEKTDYGMGWATDMYESQANRAAKVYPEEEIARAKAAFAGAPIVGHTGGSVGGLTVFLTIPDAPGDVAVVGVSNNDGLSPVFGVMVAAEFVEAAKENALP